MERAYEMLSGEIITFSDSPAFSTTFLKISKAKEFPEPTRVV
jgi:hypothetical protein